MSTIAFLGLGQMGAPMAGRLLEAGHDVIVWNRTAARAADLADRGAVVASSPAAAAANVEFAITMLATPEALEQVLFGPDGLAPALGQEQILIEMSTVGPDVVRSVAARLPEGASVVDAPVRGSITEANDGRLHVLAGASEDDFARVRPILESFGDVRLVGGQGSGAAMKLVANSTLGASIVALGEALALGTSLGLDRDALFEVLAQTPLGSLASSRRPSVESGRYPPRFKLRLAAKDMRLVLDAADGKGLDLKAARAATGWLDVAVADGFGELDYSAVLATITGEPAGP